MFHVRSVQLIAIGLVECDAIQTFAQYGMGFVHGRRVDEVARDIERLESEVYELATGREWMYQAKYNDDDDDIRRFGAIRMSGSIEASKRTKQNTK